VLEQRKLSQAEAAKVLGVTQPKVSALRHYKLVGFSVERLMNLLMALDHDIEIVIRPKPPIYWCRRNTQISREELQRAVEHLVEAANEIKKLERVPARRES
jgi:transcriptional regulator with XRE-family HTH domain